MNKVYLVYTGEYSDRRVEYVSDLKEKANDIATILGGCVEEMVLNELVDTNWDKNWYHKFTSHFKTDSTFEESMRDIGSTYDVEYCDFEQYENESTVVELSAYSDTLAISVYVSSLKYDKEDGLKKAFKIACDKIAKVKEKIQEIGAKDCQKLADEGFEF